MTAHIDISNIPLCDIEPKRLALLNNHIAIHDMLQAGGISTATGCHPNVAKQVMDAIATAGAGEYVTLIYHVDCPGVHADDLGPPAASVHGTVAHPVQCELCGGMIGTDATYREDVIVLREEVEFVMGAGHGNG